MGKMKFVAFASLIASAAAFAPAPVAKTSSALNVNELELGVTEPLGVYDPLGWLDSEPEAFERRRAVERKHGRICMIALIGQIVHANGIVFDGYISKSSNLKFADIVDEEIKARKLNAELNNGRAAMLAVFGNMVGEAATGQTLAESWGDGAILGIPMA